jgi:hypothetical protein
VQAMLKDGGVSFKCVQSSAWRKDSKSPGPSDFMTAGEHFGQLIPAVPKGFVRWVQLRKINEPDAHKHAYTDRTVCYIYCGDANVVPDTAGWAPFDGKLAAAMRDKQGSQRIVCMRPPPSAPTLMSVERCLQENPLLKSAGVTLDDFNFSIAKQSSTAQLAPSQAAAPTAEQASPVPVQPLSSSLESAEPSVQPSVPSVQQTSPVVSVQPLSSSLESAVAGR